MTEELSRSAKRVQDALALLGTVFEVVQLPSSTRTAVEAANAIGCSLVEFLRLATLSRFIQSLTKIC